MFQGYSRVVPACFGGCSGDVLGCSAVFRGVPGFTDTPRHVQLWTKFIFKF